MALVPGLRRFSEDRQELSRVRSRRAETPDPNNVRLPDVQSNARPVQTEGRVQLPATGDDETTAFAKSLAAINPAINRFLDTVADEGRSEAEEAARGRLGGMTFEEAREAVQRGEMGEFSNPWFRAAFTRQFGERHALWRAGQLQTEYQTNFDRDNGDIEGFLAAPVREDLEAFGNDRHFRAGYGRAMTQFANRVRAQHSEHLAGRARTETLDGVYETFLGDARAAIQAGQTPQQIHERLRGRYQGNLDLLRVDFRTQDREILRVAEALAAEGHYDVVRELLQGDRGGLGPLANVRDHATQAARILETADRERRQRNGEAAFDQRMRFFDAAASGTLNREDLFAYHRANPGVFSDANVQSLVSRNDQEIEQARVRLEREQRRIRTDREYQGERDQVLLSDFLLAERGQLPFVTLPARVRSREDIENGRDPSQEISADARRRNVVEAYVAQSGRTAQERGETPEQQFNREVGWFSRNGVVHPTWENVISTGFVSASGPTTTGQEVPPALQAGIELYRRLHASNPRLLRAHVSDQGAYDFYEAVRVGMEYGGLSEQQALSTAITVTRDPARLQSTALRQRYEDIATTMNQLNSWLPWGTDVENGGAIAPQVERLARFYAMNGLSADKALEEARKRIEATHTNVNGWLVYTADRRVPQNFSDMVGRQIESYVTQFGQREGVRARDLTVRALENGTGAWVIVHKSTGMPVEDMAGRTFTLATLQTAEEARLESERAAASARTNRRNQRNTRPTSPMTSEDGAPLSP